MSVLMGAGRLTVWFSTAIFLVMSLATWTDAFSIGQFILNIFNNIYSIIIIGSSRISCLGLYLVEIDVCIDAGARVLCFERGQVIFIIEQTRPAATFSFSG